MKQSSKHLVAVVVLILLVYSQPSRGFFRRGSLKPPPPPPLNPRPSSRFQNFKNSVRNVASVTARLGPMEGLRVMGAFRKPGIPVPPGALLTRRQTFSAAPSWGSSLKLKAPIPDPYKFGRSTSLRPARTLGSGFGSQVKHALGNVFGNYLISKE